MTASPRSSCRISTPPTTSRAGCRNDHDADDIAQEAVLRALRYGDSFSGQNPRAWLLAIVRNTFFSMRKGNIPAETAVPFDEEMHQEQEQPSSEAQLIRRAPPS